ncbi:MAG: divalent-cation tolerance protein CutA [Longimicrobiales bacterium]|nr:divalent-cation tolerance protein CutA [Longimicrobiales bacterium]
MPTDVRAVLVTAPDPEAAEAIARALVEEGLIACASLVPGVVSIYRWKGELKRDREVLLVMKTTAARIPVLRDRTAELHPYEVPEVLVLPVDDGFGPYLEWVRAEVEGRS